MITYFFKKNGIIFFVLFFFSGRSSSIKIGSFSIKLSSSRGTRSTVFCSHFFVFCKFEVRFIYLESENFGIRILNAQYVLNVRGTLRKGKQNEGPLLQLQSNFLLKTEPVLEEDIKNIMIKTVSQLLFKEILWDPTPHSEPFKLNLMPKI